MCLRLIYRERVGVNGARWLAGENYNEFKASAFARAFFVWIYCWWLFFVAENRKIYPPPLDEKRGEWVEENRLESFLEREEVWLWVGGFWRRWRRFWRFCGSGDAYAPLYHS